MISIALATYNGEKYLSEQLDSILNQSYSDFELIISDDCSKDKTQSILKEYELKDKRIHVSINSENLGFKKNFEKLCSLCNCELIAFSDQDDIWEKDKLKLSLSNLKNYDFVCSNALIVDSENKFTGVTMMEYINISKVSPDKKDVFKRLLMANVAQGSTMLIKKEFLKKYLPIPESLKFHDWYFAFMSCKENGFYYIEQPLLRYRQHSDNVTKNEYKRTLKIKLEQMFNFRQSYNDALTNINFFETYPLPEELKKEIQPMKKFLLNQYSFYGLTYFCKNYNVIRMDTNKIKKYRRVVKYVLQVIIYNLFYKRNKN